MSSTTNFIDITLDVEIMNIDTKSISQKREILKVLSK